MYLRYSLLCLLVLLPLFAVAQDLTPKYSNEFLSIGVGARALGMSGAQTAHVAGVNAGYWNPAGLLKVEADHSIALMHAEYFAGIAKYDYAAYNTAIDSSSSLGISLIRFGIDNIPDTRFLYDANGTLNYDNIRFFSAADYALLLSYAREIKQIPGLQAGASAKIVHRNVGKFANAWGFGLDAGLQWQRKGWQLGLMLRDITTTFNAWSINTELLEDVYAQTGNEVPESSLEITLPKAILGIAHTFSIKESFSILAAADLVTTFDGTRNVLLKADPVSVDPHLGLELGYKRVVWLRGGLGQFQQVTELNAERSKITTMQPTAGIGVRLGNFKIDYALTDVGDASDAPYSHVFSLTLNFNKKND
ncbi:PorV/PorQ family protein [Cesiribacter sp. SM1]|uniref:putative type IX sorting system protein PorV2 n=1 Tax=Cesiribacter sp. SM1 TaxID=2861196 RepID=UPI001CD58D93|nr:PorV/PorQ family protein [Cesiribacter sp. SM1]